MNLFEQVQNTTNKEEFLNFLLMLTNDFKANKEAWENDSVDTFLESIHAWVSDYHSSDIDFKNPTWKTIAAMFYMGKLYE